MVFWLVSQPILRWEDKVESKGASSHEENVRSRHQHLFEENVRKNAKGEGMWILKMRVQELFMHGEGISISRVCHKGRQSLIECARHDFKIMYFPLFYIFLMYFCFLCLLFFWVNKGVALTPIYPQVRWGIPTYVVLKVRKLVCYIDLIFFERLILIANTNRLRHWT